jgi:hypothetical protein
MLYETARIFMEYLNELGNLALGSRMRRLTERHGLR